MNDWFNVNLYPPKLISSLSAITCPFFNVMILKFNLCSVTAWISSCGMLHAANIGAISFCSADCAPLGPLQAFLWRDKDDAVNDLPHFVHFFNNFRCISFSCLFKLSTRSVEYSQNRHLSILFAWLTCTVYNIVYCLVFDISYVDMPIPHPHPIPFIHTYTSTHSHTIHRHTLTHISKERKREQICMDC